MIPTTVPGLWKVSVEEEEDPGRSLLLPLNNGDGVESQGQGNSRLFLAEQQIRENYKKEKLENYRCSSWNLQLNTDQSKELWGKKSIVQNIGKLRSTFEVICHNTESLKEEGRKNILKYSQKFSNFMKTMNL